MNMQEQPELVEVDVIRDTFVSGVGDIQVMGANARVTLYVDQQALGERPAERIVVAKLIFPVDAIPACINSIMKATWHQLTHVSLLEVSIADRAGRH